VLIVSTTGVGASLMPGQRFATNIARETFIVSGTVVREDKTPIDGVKVMIAEAKDAGYAIGIGDDGLLQNPSAVTDAKGRFSMTVKRSLFKDRQEFVLVVPLFDRIAQPTRLARGVVAIKIDNTAKEYKLGEIGRESPFIR
jgi:hypothetical protein